MYSDARNRRVPLLHVLAVSLLIILSQYWLPFLSNNYFDCAHALLSWGNSQTRSDWTDVSQPMPPDTGTVDLQSLRAEIARLQKENHLLQDQILAAGVIRKMLDEDLRFISADLVGPAGIMGRDLWILNCGSSSEVRVDDLVLQNGRVTGKIVSVASSCSLAEKSTASMNDYVVKIEGDDRDYLWQGRGENSATILYQDKSSEEALGKEVTLSRSASRGGGLPLGIIQNVLADKPAEMKQLMAKGYEIEFSNPFLIMQVTDEIDADSFIQRDRLAKLKAEVNSLERLKLRMELWKIK
ncbi:MAG: hypothetical protein HQL31_11380 [Planctomycetes bacterium]|nr:hypothetical protein [Planctomycetota bacterium]